MRAAHPLPAPIGPALLLLGALGAGFVCTCPARAQDGAGGGGGAEGAARLRIIVDGAVHGGRLATGAPAQDFAAMLPLELAMEDYAGKEKIAQPPRAIRTGESRGGHKPEAGDMTLFAPWGNLAFFYGPFQAHSGLHLLGRMDAGALAALSGPGPRQVRIELAE